MRQFLGNIEDFIELVKRRPALYNFTLDEFNDKKLTEQLWEEVAREFNTNVNYCKSKWGVLRVSFARQIRNEKTNSKRSSETLINDWYLKDNMSFMRNFMRRRKRPNSNYNNDDSLSESTTTVKVKTETNLPNTLFEIKNEPVIEDENESIASLEIFVDDENIMPSDCISLASISSLSKTESDRIENEFETSLCSGASQKRKTIEQNEQSSSNFKRIKDRYYEAPLKGNKTEDQLLSNSQRKTKEQEDLSQNQKDDVNLQFFKSILPDFNKLSGRRQRLLKQKVMIELNTFLDEQENES